MLYNEFEKSVNVIFKELLIHDCIKKHFNIKITSSSLSFHFIPIDLYL